MVTVRKSENPQNVDLPNFVKPFGNGQSLAGFQRIEFKILDHSNRDFQAVLKDILDVFLVDHKVYSVFVESAAQPRATLRTRKKLFFELKKQCILLPSQVFDTE